MKKISKIYAVMTILLIAVAGVITFVACNKKNEMVNNIVKTNVVSISPDDDMDGYLLDLRKRMKSATKDGEAMPLADVEFVEDLYIGVHNYPPNYTTTHEFWTINYDTGVRNCTLHLMDD